MKTLLIFVAIFLLLSKWQDIKLHFSPSPSFQARGDAQVLVYSTSWCGYCKRAKFWLDKNQVAYTELDVEKDPKASKEFNALGGGGVPLISIDGKLIRGYDTARMQALLEITEG